MPVTSLQITNAVPPGSVRGIYQLIVGTVPLSGITAADILTTYVMPHKFKVLDIRAIVNTAVTTASKAATLTAKITPAGGTATNVTGAALAMTSANMTPVGKVNSATATDILAGGTNQGNAGDSISITASGVTAFVEGLATIVLTVQDMDVS